MSSTATAPNKSRRRAQSAEGPPLFEVKASGLDAERLLQAFANDSATAIDLLRSDFRDAAARSLNGLLDLEMDDFLSRRDQANNGRDGYLHRDYYLKGLGKVRLRIPKDRRRAFRSAVIPPDERVDPRLIMDIAALVLCGVKQSDVAGVAGHVLGVSLSADVITATFDRLKEVGRQWFSRPITSTCWALYAGGVRIKMGTDEQQEPMAALVVIAIDESMHWSPLAIEVGDPDSRDAWDRVFRGLKDRGLKPRAVRVGILEAKPELSQAFRRTFAHAAEARCWHDCLRQAAARAPASLRRGFRERAEKAMFASDADAACRGLEQLERVMGENADTAVTALMEHQDELLAHYAFEREYWLALKTTNPIRRLQLDLSQAAARNETLIEFDPHVFVALVALKLEASWRRQRISSRSIRKLVTVETEAIASAEATREAVDTLCSSIL